MARDGTSRLRRVARLAWRGGAAVVLAYVVSVVCGMPVAWPFDCLVNAGGVEVVPALRLPADGRRRVVVLQHGIWRSSYALLRLQRTLQAHGYEVHNLDYWPSGSSACSRAGRWTSCRSWATRWGGS